MISTDKLIGMLESVVRASSPRSVTCRAAKAAAERLTLAARVADLAAGCPSCDYDEADGALFRHCDKCMFEITRAAWDLRCGNAQGK